MGVRVRQPGQVRKEAATTDSSGSSGSFFAFDNRGRTAYDPDAMGDSSDMFGQDSAASDGTALPSAAGPSAAGPSAAELEAGQSAMFGAPDPLPEPPEPQSIAAAAQPYRVLARKYRPQNFSQLIGQDAMVQTLANAIRRERLAHAFLMTGVRGVGKTSTARLIAKALNCIGPDGKGGPTIDSCGVCDPCVAIAEGRYIDVIEMDAASNTGIDDVREIIEAVRYAAVSARYKIYIIDEVHMLSRQAFNGLLKTLEEPPPHVKFLFATTEVDKLPVTVLSRCQRFDLRRIAAPLLTEHFAAICQAEGVAAEPEALAMIAEAAEGSVRDGLSILDQAIAHSDFNSDGAESAVSAAQVRDMLGLADKTVQRRLFAALLGGDGSALLELVAAQYALGIEPIALIRSAMELAHRITVCQVGRGEVAVISVDEREAIADWAAALTPGQLHRLWQLLLKGHDEVRGAPDPLVAAEMALLRCLHAANLPDPGALAKRIEEAAAGGMLAMSGLDAAPGAAAPVAAGPDWAQLTARIGAHHLRLGQVMHDWIRVVELAPGVLRYGFAAGYSEDCARELRGVLEQVIGGGWLVEQVDGAAGAPTLRELADLAKAEEAAVLRQSPLVEAVFAAFPGAEMVEDDEKDKAGAHVRRA